MQIEFAYIPGTTGRAIGVVVSVQRAVLDQPTRREQVRRQVGMIADFRGLPVVLAALDGARVRYHGDERLVPQLARIDALALPWRTAELGAA